MCKKHGLKKAFTLTELLVVVIVSGVLAAVAVPKFSRVLETRRTTEAEEVLSALRTEQEYRCVQGKNYQMNVDQLGGLASAKNSKNYAYSLTATGAKATSGKGYSISMPSYQNGQLCCEGDYCGSLNKSYPACSSLAAPSEDACAGEIKCQGSAEESCGCKGAGKRTRTCNSATGAWSEWSTCSAPATCGCSGPDTRECGCDTGNQDDLGHQTRTCNTSTGEWGPWGACEGYRKNKYEQCHGVNGGLAEKKYECSYDSTGDSWYWRLVDASDCDEDDTSICSEGQKQTEACGCGSDRSGTRTRTCPKSREWGPWSPCTGFKEYIQADSCNLYKCVEGLYGMSLQFVKNTCTGGSGSGSGSGGDGTWRCWVSNSYIDSMQGCADTETSFPTGSCTKKGESKTVKTYEGVYGNGGCIVDINTCVCQ